MTAERMRHVLARATAAAVVAGVLACTDSDPTAPEATAVPRTAAAPTAALAALEYLLPALEDDALHDQLAFDLGDLSSFRGNRQLEVLWPAIARSRERVQHAVEARSDDPDLPVLAAIQLILDYSAKEGER